MGCNISSDVKKEANELDNYLSNEEVDLVRKSWKAIENDLDETGMIMFKRFFEQQQEMKKLFKRLLSNSESGNFIFDDDRLRGHARIVMNSLGAAVDSLDDSSSLSGMLVALGEKHAAYNVKGEMISFLWPAIRDAFKVKLGDQFTQETELAWRHVFEYIKSNLSEGIKQGELELMETGEDKSVVF
ncbi:neuroglobin-like [Haliotis cracherodii]|uniref:neuroglobin-like n=1 Tax=Haliotis cracherodii TaxID=6455 RepID=UPI0039E8E866